MRLKVITATCVFFAVAMMVGYPWILGRSPHNPIQAAQYVLRSIIYICLIVAALIVATACSLIILRQAREAYRVEKEELMKHLLEESLRDHGRKAGGSE